MRVRVIADKSENKAGQPVAPGRMYILTRARALDEELQVQEIHIVINCLPKPEEKLLNSAIQLALHRKTRRVVDHSRLLVALQWEGNDLVQTRFLSVVAAVHRLYAHVVSAISITSTTPKKNMCRCSARSGQPDCSATTSSGTMFFPSHFILCCTSKTGFYLKNKQNNPPSILLQKKIENFNCL